MRSNLASSLYVGEIKHHRTRPRSHRLAYRAFYLLIDLDELAELDGALRSFSHNRFNLFSFRDRDYGDGSGRPLRAYMEETLLKAGIEPDGGPIRLLTLPRILGYAFNPLSIYFCFRKTGEAAAIVYEVNNTFGERHSYVIPTSSDGGNVLQQECDKAFHVSPFLGMEMSYRFRLRLPGEKIALSISALAEGSAHMTASLVARRQLLSDRALLRVFFLYPLLTLKVLLGIHWEALLIWSKGASLHRRPAAPTKPLSVGRNLPLGQQNE